MKRGTVALGLALALAAPCAFAADPVLGAVGEAGSGIEIGGGNGAFQLQRARTQLRAGLELALDDKKLDSIRALVLGEIEPRPAVGFDVEWCHHLSRSLFLQGGVVGLIAPQSMFGVTAGARVQIPLGARARFTIGPQVAGFFFGTDVPDGTVVLHALFVAGVDVAF